MNPNTKELPAEPTSEEESRFDTGRAQQAPTSYKPTKGIDAKDSRAFMLATGCLVVLAGIGVIDAWQERDILADSPFLNSFTEILKYVITTSLGFFFATTVARKE